MLFVGKDLADQLRVYRRVADNVAVTFETNIKFYTDITFGLLDWSQATVKVPISDGSLWTMIISLGIQQRASDYIGSQRALGSTYFTTCRFTPEDFAWFNQLHGSDGVMLEASSYHCCLSFSRLCSDVEITWALIL